MNRWAGKLALVTGANSGIGAAVAQNLVKNGMKVIGVDKSNDELEKMSTALNPEYPDSLTHVTCDVTNDEAVEQLFETIEQKFGTIHVCVNNAGVMHTSSLLSGNPKVWRHMLDVNLVALCYCSTLAIKLMRKTNVNDGHIINMASVLGHKVLPLPDTHFYSATKAGVLAFCEGLRQELREKQTSIRVTSICPGMVDTNILKNANFDPAFTQKFFEQIKTISSEDIAEIVQEVLAKPAHVQIKDLIIDHTDQNKY